MDVSILVQAFEKIGLVTVGYKSLPVVIARRSKAINEVGLANSAGFLFNKAVSIAVQQRRQSCI